MFNLDTDALTITDVGRLPIVKSTTQKASISSAPSMPWSKTNLDVPIIGATRDGNSSDKPLNNELLGSISRHMARHGIDPGAFIYVADSALITHDNLKRAEQNGNPFSAIVKDATTTEYFCQADARQDAEQLAAQGRGSYHRIRTEVVQRPKFGRGRQAKKTDFDCFFPKTRGYTESSVIFSKIGG
jgi:hypothetical protein